MGQPVMNGAVYYHNGVPYTYQNGVAVFAGNPSGSAQATQAALDALASPSAVLSAAQAQQPFLFPHPQSPHHGGQMILPNSAAAAALLSAAHVQAAQGQPQQQHFFPQHHAAAAALQQQVQVIILWINHQKYTHRLLLYFLRSKKY